MAGQMEVDVMCGRGYIPASPLHRETYDQHSVAGHRPECAIQGRHLNRY
jgi:hypothetical protein